MGEAEVGAGEEEVGAEEVGAEGEVGVGAGAAEVNG